MDEAIRSFVIESNAIEGYFLEGDTRVWDRPGGQCFPWSHPLFERHYNTLMALITSAKAGILVHPNEFHRLLMYGLLPERLVGQVRDVNVHVGGHQAPQPESAAILLDKWWAAALRYTSEFECSSCDAGMIWMFHKAFEYIHPYADGNGRTGRAMMAAMFVMTGRPVEPVRFEDRMAYYGKLAAFEKRHTPSSLGELLDKLARAPVVER